MIVLQLIHQINAKQYLKLIVMSDAKVYLYQYIKIGVTSSAYKYSKILMIVLLTIGCYFICGYFYNKK